MNTTTSINEEIDSENTVVERLRGLLNQLLRISTNDGRVFIGTFSGTDKPLNLILLNVEEYRISGPDAKPEGRFIGQVIFPWKVILKVEARSTSSKRDAGSQRGDDGLYSWCVRSFIESINAKNRDRYRSKNLPFGHNLAVGVQTSNVQRSSLGNEYSNIVFIT